jgi:multicomponent Na+:H+ antiporter subunit E
MFVKITLLFLVWIGLTNSFDTQELFVGLVVSFIIAYFFTPNSRFSLKELILKYIKFIPIFLKNLVQSNIAVAKIVLNPKLPINTGIVKLKTNLLSDYDRLILSNAITLTPGTITVELRENNLFIHILNMDSLNRDILQQKIIDELERGLVK